MGRIAIGVKGNQILQNCGRSLVSSPTGFVILK